MPCRLYKHRKSTTWKVLGRLNWAPMCLTYQDVNIQHPAVLSGVNTKHLQVKAAFIVKYSVEGICYFCAKLLSSPAFKFRSSICWTKRKNFKIKQSILAWSSRTQGTIQNVKPYYHPCWEKRIDSEHSWLIGDPGTVNLDFCGWDSASPPSSLRDPQRQIWECICVLLNKARKLHITGQLHFRGLLGFWPPPCLASVILLDLGWGCSRNCSRNLTLIPTSVPWLWCSWHQADQALGRQLGKSNPGWSRY